MTESTPINVQAFQPFDGGMGARLAVTTVTGSVAIPGTQAGDDKLRVLVTNREDFPVSIRMGQPGVEATLACMEIPRGTSVLLKPPVSTPSLIWIAAICEGGVTSIQVTAGNGT